MASIRLPDRLTDVAAAEALLAFDAAQAVFARIGGALEVKAKRLYDELEIVFTPTVCYR